LDFSQSGMANHSPTALASLAILIKESSPCFLLVLEVLITIAIP
jgi:hypothetical protein